VLDASAIVELLFATDNGAHIDRAVRNAVGLFAPAHVDAEVASAIGRLVRAGAVPADMATDALGDLAEMPVTRVPLPPLLQEAWALRANVAVRDALYVVVAQRVHGVLITTDARLRRAVQQQRLAEVGPAGPFSPASGDAPGTSG
jgi:predicted nucleic acid-binding protein